MVVDDFDDFGVLKAIGRLQRLAVVDKDHLIALAHTFDEARGLDTVLGKNPLSLGRKAAEANSFVRHVFAVLLGELVFQIGIANRSRNRVVIGILVAEHQNRRHRVSSLFHFIQIIAKQCTMAESREPVRVQ